MLEKAARPANAPSPGVPDARGVRALGWESPASGAERCRHGALRLGGLERSDMNKWRSACDPLQRRRLFLRLCWQEDADRGSVLGGCLAAPNRDVPVVFFCQLLHHPEAEARTGLLLRSEEW